MTRTRSRSLRIESGASMELLSRKRSAPVFGTVRVSFISPGFSGFQVITSCKRLIAGITTDFVTTSPFEDFISRMAASSRGSELSMVKGIRNGLPAMAKVGTSKLVSATSGRRVSEPSGTAKTGMFFIRRRVAACDGGGPVFQSPSLKSTTALRRGCFSAA